MAHTANVKHCRVFLLDLVTIEFLFPTIVLQLSLMKATTFFQGIPFASNVASSWSNMDCAVPILQIGMSRNPMTALSLTSSKYLTTLARVFCWLVSLDSSHPNEKAQFYTVSLVLHPKLERWNFGQSSSSWTVTWFGHRRIS